MVSHPPPPQDFVDFHFAATQLFTTFGNNQMIAFYLYVLCCLGMLMTSWFWGAKPILGRKRITLPEPGTLEKTKCCYLRKGSKFYGNKIVTFVVGLQVTEVEC